MVLLEWVLGNLPGFVAVLCAFGFIIFIHELGHFLTARRVGIRCPRFAIGFGPRLFSFDYRGTEFSICLLPFGGFVQMLGEDPGADEAQGEFKLVSSYLTQNSLPASRDEVLALLDAQASEVPEADKREFESVRGHVQFLPDRRYETVKELEGNFNDKTIPQRMAVVVGGVTMNFISALLLFWIVGAVYGLWHMKPDSLPLALKVYDGSPAAAAGLKYGDRVEAVNGVPIVSGDEMIDAIGRFPGQPIQLTLDRGGQKLQVDVTPNVQIGSLTFHPDKTKDGLPVLVSGDAFGQGSDAPDLKAGAVIEAVDGKPVRSVPALVEAFREVSLAGEKERKVLVSIALTVQGMPQPTKLELSPSEAKPTGKIGIMPAQVTEFKFVDRSTNQVASVLPGSPADKAGFRAGDQIYYLNGRSIADVTSLDSVLGSLADRGRAAGGEAQPMKFVVARAGERVEIEMPPSVPDTAALGLTLEPVTFGLVVKSSLTMIWRLIWAPVTIVDQILNKLLNPDLVKAGMSGPLGIMQMIFELTDQGLGKFLFIVALINAAVGAFNLIPFPALDGARLLVLMIGGLRGRELDYKKEAYIHQIGLFILLGVVLLVTAMDIQRLWAGVPLTK